MPEAVAFAIEIITLTPLSVGAGGSSGTRADKSIVRDGLGRPLLPGSQLKGRLRHAAEALLAGLDRPVPTSFDDDDSPDNLIRQIFGSPMHRSPLRFADLRCRLDDAALDLDAHPVPGHRLSEIRPSVAINRRRRTAEDKLLMIQEAAVGGLRFAADPAIVGQLPALEHAALLWAALLGTSRWGGAKSRGLGWATLRTTVQWAGEPVPELELAAALRRALGGA